MILDLTSPSPITKVHEEAQAYRLKRDLYDKNRKMMRNSQPPKDIVNKIQQSVLKLQKFYHRNIIDPKKQICDSKADEEPLPVYPHGYYANYIPIAQSCLFEDELRMIFPYFNKLHQNNLDNTWQLDYEQISSLMIKTEKQKGKLKREQKNDQFVKTWQKCLNKYLCPLDSIRRVDIYLQTLKFGTAVMDKAYERQKLVCSKPVFYKSILNCAVYFHIKKAELDPNIKTFSIECGKQINEITMPKTMKMLYCPLCEIYDCGKHDDDPMKFEYDHNFVAPSNLHSNQDLLSSALELITKYKQINSAGFGQHLPASNDCESLCSARCYLKLKNSDDLQQLRAQKNKFIYPATVKGIIKMGIHIFTYDPCSIWYLADEGKNRRIHISCDLVFLYFLQEYDLIHKIQNKLFETQSTFFRSLKQREELPIIIKSKKANKKSSSSALCNNRKSICHHYFLNESPIDEGCMNCVCAQRGFCLQQCLCSQNCPFKQGCNCKNERQCIKNSCVCYQKSRECQPGLCANCFDYDNVTKSNRCQNKGILLRKNSRLKVGTSTIANIGLGLFAGEDLKKNQLICTYAGEIIDSEIEIFRESLTQTNDFYNFALAAGESIDSRFIGNRSRFINHGNSGDENIVSQIKLSEGKRVVVFFAKRDIKCGEELFFDYDGTGMLEKNHKEKYPFIKKK